LQASYEAHLAARLAERIGVSPDKVPSGKELNEVACRHLSKGGQIDDLYPELFMISREEESPLPEPLLQLASIWPFRLL
jgi:hypothetical protein